MISMMNLGCPNVWQSGKDYRLRLHRRGILMVEVLISALVIGTAMVVLLPGMVAVKRQRLDQRFEVMAMIELNNIADELKGGQRSPQLNSWFQSRYRTASLSTEVLSEAGLVPEGSGLDAVRIRIRRPKPAGNPDQVVSVVIWVPVEESGS